MLNLNAKDKTATVNKMNEWTKVKQAYEMACEQKHWIMLIYWNCTCLNSSWTVDNSITYTIHNKHQLKIVVLCA